MLLIHQPKPHKAPKTRCHNHEDFKLGCQKRPTAFCFFSFFLQSRTIDSQLTRFITHKLSFQRFLNEKLETGLSCWSVCVGKKKKIKTLSWRENRQSICLRFSPLSRQGETVWDLRAMKQAKKLPGPNDGSFFVPSPKKQAPPCPPPSPRAWERAEVSRSMAASCSNVFHAFQLLTSSVWKRRPECDGPNVNRAPSYEIKETAVVSEGDRACQALYPAAASFFIFSGIMRKRWRSGRAIKKWLCICTALQDEKLDSNSPTNDRPNSVGVPVTDGRVHVKCTLTHPHRLLTKHLTNELYIWLPSLKFTWCFFFLSTCTVFKYEGLMRGPKGRG